jgi:hypothetical protein
MNLIMVGVGIVQCEMINVTGYMISGTQICVLRLVSAQRRCSSSCALVRDVILFKTVPTIIGGVSYLEAHLTLRSCRTPSRGPEVIVGGTTVVGPTTTVTLIRTIVATAAG